MKERPILFSAPMVRAMLDGRKTQTRRVLKDQPPASALRVSYVGQASSILHGAWVAEMADGTINTPRPCPYGAPGDRLWVRESFRLRADQDNKPPSQDWWKSGAWYPATDDCEPSGCGGGAGKLRPSIHMPRWASRLTLDVLSVRVERLHDISEEDARAEGVEGPGEQWSSCRVRFAELWREINGAASRDATPWVWVIGFKRVERP